MWTMFNEMGRPCELWRLFCIVGVLSGLYQALHVSLAMQQPLGPPSGVSLFPLEPSNTASSKKKPVFVVGYPKSGTTSIFRVFNCSGVRTQHYCSGESVQSKPPCKLMSLCILDNMANNRTMLEGCGDYDVYAQLDGERMSLGPLKNRSTLLEDGTYSNLLKDSHFLPQHWHLERLAAEHPGGTFVLPLRDAQDWAASVMNWFAMGPRVVNEYVYFDPTLARPNGKDERFAFLARIYQEHTEYVRDFAQRNPSHTLVEVNLTDEKSIQNLVEHFGLEASCWGHHNANKREKTYEASD